MSLADKINNDIKEAMKAKQADRLLALRAIKSERIINSLSEYNLFKPINA